MRKNNSPHVTLKGYSKDSKQAIKEQYNRLIAEGKFKGSFQKYLNNTGQQYFETFFKNFSKSAGKFSVNALLNVATDGKFKKFFIK